MHRQAGNNDLALCGRAAVDSGELAACLCIFYLTKLLPINRGAQWGMHYMDACVWDYLCVCVADAVFFYACGCHVAHKEAKSAEK